MSEASERSGTIQSVERAARLLALFTSQRPQLSLAEMCEGFGFGKATTHRYAMSLRRAELLKYDASTNLYSVGPRAISLAGAAVAGVPMLSAAAVYMRRLSEAVEETVALSVWDGEAPVVVHVASPASRTIHAAVRVGVRLAEGMAQYKVFHAFGPDDLRIKASAATRAELEKVRDTEVAFATGQGWRAAACPVFDGRGLAACLAIIGVADRISDDPESQACMALRTAARELSEEITLGLGLQTLGVVSSASPTNG